MFPLLFKVAWLYVLMSSVPANFPREIKVCPKNLLNPCVTYTVRFQVYSRSKQLLGLFDSGDKWINIYLDPDASGFDRAVTLMHEALHAALYENGVWDQSVKLGVHDWIYRSEAAYSRLLRDNPNLAEFYTSYADEDFRSKAKGNEGAGERATSRFWPAPGRAQLGELRPH